MLKTGQVSDLVPASKLLAFYALRNPGNLIHARKVFDGFKSPNAFMWNAMIKAYANSAEPEEALKFYCRMVSRSAPQNNYTFPSVLKACSALSALEETKQIHARIVKMGFGSEIYALNSLLHVYAAKGNIESANLIFDRIPERDIVSLNSMIHGYVRLGEMSKAEEFFRNTPEKKSIISWTTMISGYVNAGLEKEALSLFHEMQMDGFEPDNVALTSSLAACSRLGALEQGNWICSYIEKNGIHVDSRLGCALIDMYVKCGDIESALKIFRDTKRKEVSTWTAMIEGFAIHGRGREALEWFEKMQDSGIKPNSITFTAILTACSHAGLIDEGKLLFRSIKNPTIEHYGCMVDLLGRSGLLKEAKDFLDAMPLKPNETILGALLNACNIHRNLELGKQIGNMLIELDPKHDGRYIQLSKIHAAAGEWDRAVNVRNRMRDSRVLKLPGCSLISANGIIHEFFSGDRSHPQIQEINRAWESVAKRLRERGYEPVTGDLLLDLDEAEKQTAIQQHSEKFAITFGLIKSNSGEPVRVFNNLRVCQDCHNAAKLISDIYERDIILRDRVRFHVFKEGKCSCGDYW